MRLFILGLAALALALACSPPQSTSVQEKPPTFANFQAWAGKDAAGLGFTQEKLVAFLAARKANLNAARQPEWTTWLKTLEQTDNPSLKAWALARQVEAGDYTAYPTFESILARNLLGLSKPGRRDEDLVIHDPPQTPLPACLPGPRILNPRLRIFGLEMPGALPNEKPRKTRTEPEAERPFSYHWEKERPIYLVASLNKNTILYFPFENTKDERGKMILLANDLLLSLEV